MMSVMYWDIFDKDFLLDIRLLKSSGAMNQNG